MGQVGPFKAWSLSPKRAAAAIALTVTLFQPIILAKVVGELGTRVHHVKPHGALYHAAQKNEAIATAIANAAHRFDKTLVLVEQASTAVLSVQYR